MIFKLCFVAIFCTQPLFCCINFFSVEQTAFKSVIKLNEERDKMRGCDYRLSLFRVYRAMLAIDCRPHILEILGTLAEICQIAYSGYSCRTRESILRLHNVCHRHHQLCRKFFFSPKTMSRAKFFGIYFHTITVEFPMVYRLVCLKSLLEESKERTFTDLKSISRATSSGQPQHIIHNGLVRFQEEAMLRDYQSTDVENQISRVGSNLPITNSSFALSDLGKEEIQSHFERISDFLLSDGWWHVENGRLVFLDATGKDGLTQDGPSLTHFRNTKMKDLFNHLKVCWENLLNNPSKIPMWKIRVYDEDGNYTRSIHNACPSVVNLTANDEEILPPSENLPQASQEISEEFEPGSSDTKTDAVADDVVVEVKTSDTPIFDLPSEPCVPSDDYPSTPKAIPKPFESSLCRKLATLLEISSFDQIRRFDSLRIKMRPGGSTSEATYNNYKYQEGVIQNLVLSQSSKLENSIKIWEDDYLLKHLCEPSTEDYDDSMKKKFDNLITCRKLLKEWKIRF